MSATSRSGRTTATDQAVATRGSTCGVRGLASTLQLSMQGSRRGGRPPSRSSLLLALLLQGRLERAQRRERRIRVNAGLGGGRGRMAEGTALLAALPLPATALALATLVVARRSPVLPTILAPAL